MKELLAAEEAQNRLLFKSLLTTLKPLMSEGRPEKPGVRDEIDEYRDRE
jgi:hypothetical protein